jgi:hypothetical protein
MGFLEEEFSGEVRRGLSTKIRHEISVRGDLNLQSVIFSEARPDSAPLKGLRFVFRSQTGGVP